MIGNVVRWVCSGWQDSSSKGPEQATLSKVDSLLLAATQRRDDAGDFGCTMTLKPYSALGWFGDVFHGGGAGSSDQSMRCGRFFTYVSRRAGAYSKLLFGVPADVLFRAHVPAAEPVIAPANKKRKAVN